MPHDGRTWILWRALALVVAVSAAAACATPSSAKESASGAAQAQEPKVIQHQVPRRDFVGHQPDKFVWTAVPEADHYAIGVWNEVDRLLWRKDDITGTSVRAPRRAGPRRRHVFLDGLGTARRPGNRQVGSRGVRGRKVGVRAGSLANGRDFLIFLCRGVEQSGSSLGS